MKCGFETSGLKTLGMGVMLGVTSCVTTLPMTMSEGQVQAVRIWMDMGHKPRHVEVPRFIRADERWFYFLSFFGESGKGERDFVTPKPLRVLTIAGDVFSEREYLFCPVCVPVLSVNRDIEEPVIRIGHDCASPVRAGPIGLWGGSLRC